MVTLEVSQPIYDFEGKLVRHHIVKHGEYPTIEAALIDCASYDLTVNIAYIDDVLVQERSKSSQRVLIVMANQKEVALRV